MLLTSGYKQDNSPGYTSIHQSQIFLETEAIIQQPLDEFTEA